MSANLKIHPAVGAEIKDIVTEMTRIDIAQRTNPMIGKNNEPDYVKEAKKRCVHIIFEDGEFRLAAKKNTEGKLVCRVCGRTIYTKFDETAVTRITDCIEVINQVLLFGMLNGLKAEPIATLISIKSTLPSVAQLAKELNDFVKRENASNETVSNIGTEYNFGGNAFRPITG